MNHVSSDKLTVYILGHYRVGAADGLAEFNYRVTQLVKSQFTVKFVEFHKEKDKDCIA